MMKRLFFLLLSALLLLILVGCTASVANLPSPAASVVPTPLPTPSPSLALTGSSLPSPSEESLYDEPEEGADGWQGGNIIDETTYDSLPHPHIQISTADQASFNPSKVVDYLAASGNYDEYYELTGLNSDSGTLYVQVDVHAYMDFDAAYEVLHRDYHLSAEKIFALPFFADYCLHDGEIYQKGEWEALQAGEDTGEYEEGYLGMPLGIVSSQRYPVAKDAKVWLVDYNACNHYQISIDEFKEKYDAGAITFSEAAFKYADGKITEILEIYIP